MSNSNVLKLTQEDDFVEYYIYINNEDLDDNENTLENYLKKINSFIKKYTSTYLWHKDQFKLTIKNSNTHILDQCIRENEKDFVPHLYGITHFGDNVEDEWFIVFLLIQLTKEMDNIIVQVNDADGEFLLIEAADYLPSWATPDTSENRVYIYLGKIHIIRPENLDNVEKIIVEEALSTIIKNPTKTEASEAVQESIIRRTQDFPDKIPEKLHRATLYLPVAVAAILRANPQLVAAAVEAFCNRDPIDLKACRAMRFFPPENRVLTSVVFTKHLYAMLAHSNYVPDRRTGWNLPLQSDSYEYKAHNLGVRLACGFEILVSQAKSFSQCDNFDNDKNWLIFLNSLNTNNYFRGLLEHSKEYNNLLNQAKDYFRNLRDLQHTTPAVGAEILDLSKTLDYTVDEFKELEKNLPPEDDDSWLNINPKELETLLETRYGKPLASTDSSNLTQKLSQFMNHVSSVDGAEFPDDKLAPVRPKRGIKKHIDSPARIDDQKINFDPNEFTNAIQNILDIAIPDDSWDLESGSEMSEYDTEAEHNFDDEMNQHSLKKYMDAMDTELAQTTMGQSFEKKTKVLSSNTADAVNHQDDDDNFDDIENFEPIDIDRNALKNLVASYKMQMGDAGPAENLLGPMGIKLDDLHLNDN